MLQLPIASKACQRLRAAANPRKSPDAEAKFTLEPVATKVWDIRKYHVVFKRGLRKYRRKKRDPRRL